jgi:hypothetical protein
METEPRRKPAVRATVRLTKSKAPRVLAALVLLGTLSLTLDTTIRFDSTPTGWQFRFQLRWDLFMHSPETRHTKQDWQQISENFK